MHLADIKYLIQCQNYDGCKEYRCCDNFVIRNIQGYSRLVKVIIIYDIFL